MEEFGWQHDLLLRVKVLEVLVLKGIFLLKRVSTFFVVNHLYLLQCPVQDLVSSQLLCYSTCI